MTATFFGNVDLAQVALYMFWLFFAGLVIYLQKENQRDGYPPENEDGSLVPPNFGMPYEKVYKLSHGRGEVLSPNLARDDRTFALEPTAATTGYPFEPTGKNPLLDGVGPAAYAMRRDEPELDGHGHVKIKPMSRVEGFVHASGKDPRGMPVFGADGVQVGTVSEIWVDVPEAMARYLEVDLGAGGSRLLPVPLAKIGWRGVHVHSILSDQFADVPVAASDGQVTKLEEDKICAYYAGGKLFAGYRRNPVLEAAEA
jgi:photosynthetic reaction center H subunit